MEQEPLATMRADERTAVDRGAIIELSRRWLGQQPKRTFVPGESYIPVSGKVLDGDDLAYLIDSSLDMWLTEGRFAKEFETRLAGRFGVDKAALTVSGSAANLLAFTSLTSHKLGKDAIAPGSEVITAAAGFPTTVAPIIQNGCIPVFVDVDLATGNVLAETVERAITPRTRAIMMAHTLGNPFDLAGITELAKRHNLYLVEDCCDAFGATFQGRGVGTWGDVATVSFYPAHHITTGEGGAVLVNGAKMERIIKSFRDWGRDCWCDPGKDNTCGCRFDWKLGDLPRGYDHKYTYTHIGYNMKMTDMQAAIGISQLQKLDRFIEARRANFTAFRAALVSEGLDEHFILPEATPGSDPSWFGFLMTVRDGSPVDRNQLVQTLEDRKIGTRLLFGGNLTRQPAFKNVEYRIDGELHNAEKVMRDSFWMGVWPGIGSAERAYMVQTLRAVTRELSA